MCRNSKLVILWFCALIFVLKCDNGDVKYKPQDFCVRLITNTSALVRWFVPISLRSEIQGYTVYYTNDSTKSIHNWNLVTIGNYPMTTIPKIVLGQTYHFRVRVNPFDLNTVGPISDILSFKLSNRTKACQTIPTTEYHTLRAAATSYSSVEVWWNLPYDPHYVNGFMILYGTLESGYWYNKTTEIVQRVELTNLNKLATYIIIVAAVTDNGLIYYPNEVQVNVTPVEVPMEVKVSDITADSIVINWLPPLGLIPKKYKISYEGDKKYIDADSVIQHQSFSKVDIIVDGHLTSYELVDLIPFTVYSINVSVVPADFSYRPSINVKAKTDVGSPGPMGQPIINGLVDGDNIQIFLPKASEENGPISYYYLVVVPEQDEDHDLSKEMYSTENLLENQWLDDEEIDAPYIAAKLPSKIPYAFKLGVGVVGGFKNYKLSETKKYCVFVRAVIETPHGILQLDSPFSDYFSVIEEKRKYSS